MKLPPAFHHLLSQVKIEFVTHMTGQQERGKQQWKKEQGQKMHQIRV